MALINTLRNKMGKVLVGVIGFSIAAFVGADLLGPNSTLLGNNSTNIGEIAGQTVTYQDFIAKQDEMTFNFIQNNNGRSPNAAQQEFIRNQTWDALIGELAFEKQFDAIGLAVTDDEIIDMVQGDNISPQIIQAFTNPETGQFSKEDIITYLQNIQNQAPAQQAAWYNFERSLGPTRQRTKYNNLIVKTNYATEAEAINQYQASSATANVKYLYVPFFSIKDTMISYTDEDLKSYWSANKEEFKRDETREIKFVSFDVIPSSEDTALIKSEIEKLKLEFANTDNDSTFATINTEAEDAFENYTVETLPSALNVVGGVAAVGEVVGPVVDDGFYALYKISSTEDAEDFSARASHILFKWEDESAAAKAEAKKEARDILKQIKAGADFAQMAREYGTDGTASKGGDLGWFAQGKQMVKEFDDAVFAASKTGVLSDVIETQFGYHIIDVTAAKTKLTYNVAKVALEIYISDDTRNQVYRTAEQFALDAKDLESLESSAKELGVEVKRAPNVRKNDKRLSNIAEARSVIFWAYNKADLGDVSEVFEIDNSYIIAAVAKEQEEGTADFENVKIEVESKVKNEKKAEYIIDKLNALQEEDLFKKTIEYGDDGAKYYNMEDLKLSSNSLQNVGLAPEAVGVIFSMESGEKTEPFAIENGVIMVELVEKIEAPEISDYETYRNQVTRNRQGRLAGKVDNAVKELADIQDDRYKFF